MTGGYYGFNRSSANSSLLGIFADSPSYLSAFGNGCCYEAYDTIIMDGLVKAVEFMFYQGNCH
jgi:hypothetical protein